MDGLDASDIQDIFADMPSSELPKSDTPLMQLPDVLAQLRRNCDFIFQC